MDWLLEPSVLARLREAVKVGAKAPDIQAADRNVLSVAGSTAQVNVVGVLTNARDWMAEYFGGGNTTYKAIRDALATAMADRSVQAIDIYFDSPGGQASAEWVETMDYVALCGKKKPTRAVVGGMAASAAYGIASQCKSIVAMNRMSMVGSIGVVATYYTDDTAIDITSTDAPEKRPDPSTPEGKASIQNRLDAMHKVFVDTVAKGRGTDADTVNSKYGRGAVLLAGEALKAGMIDSINNKKKETAMTLEELKAQEPALYAQAVALGANQERDRVKAHSALGEASGDMELALKCIANGDEPTLAVQAQYQASLMKRNSLKAKDEADAAASDALKNAGDGGKQEPAADDRRAKVLAILKGEVDND